MMRKTRNGPFLVMFVVMTGGAVALYFALGDKPMLSSGLGLLWALLCLVVAILLASRRRFAGYEYEHYAEEEEE